MTTKSMNPEIIVDPNPFQKGPMAAHKKEQLYGMILFVGFLLAVIGFATFIAIMSPKWRADEAAYWKWRAEEHQRIHLEKVAQEAKDNAVVSDESLGKILSARIIPLAGEYPSVLTEVICEKRMVTLPHGPSVPIGVEGRWETKANGTTRFYWPTNAEAQ